jgi:N-acetyl-D-muramate 6-phosphate phosphatase
MSSLNLGLESVEAVLFDLDGTLIETDNLWAKIAAARLAPLQRMFPRLNATDLGRRLVMSIETPANYLVSFLEHLGLGSGFFGLANRIRRSKGVATRGGARLIPGTIELLESLQAHYKLAIVTTRARSEARSFVSLAQLERFFKVVITRQDVLCMKPHPEPLRKAAALLGVSVTRCLMVGDTEMDIHAARRAGAFSAGVLSGFGERHELERAGAHLVLESAVQLLPYLVPNQGDPTM